jgi:hypothetical protein
VTATDSIASVAREAAALVPTATLWRRIWASRIPSLDDMSKKRCPRCGRTLPARPISMEHWSVVSTDAG